MKILIVYYSRTGCTKRIAELLAAQLNADIEAIHEVQSREGALGYLSAGRDAMLKKVLPIQPFSKDPSSYDLVIIGTPIWGFTMACGVRAWLVQYGTSLKQVAFFATMKGSGDKRAFEDMTTLCQQTPVAKATFIDKISKKDHNQVVLEKFIQTLP